MTRERIVRYLCFAVLLFAFTSALNYLFYEFSLAKELTNTLIATTAVALVDRWRISRASRQK
jgi:hypothetical protein